MANTFKLKTFDGSATGAATAMTVFYYVKDAPVPAGGALEIMSGNKAVLEAADVLKVVSDTANSIDTTLSIMEQT